MRVYSHPHLTEAEREERSLEVTLLHLRRADAKTCRLCCLHLTGEKDLFVDCVKLAEDLQFSVKGENYDLLVCFVSR